MANIEIKRGRQTQVDVSYTPSGQDYTKNFFNSTLIGSGSSLVFKHTASLVIRRKVGDSVDGEVIDTLETVNKDGSNTSSSIQTSTGRIRFPNVGSTSTNPNITLHWDTDDSDLLPNENITVVGDLKINDNGSLFASSDDQIIHSFRLTFDIIPEIV